MRTLGIDLGSKRVGLSLSDAGGTFATAYDVLEVGSPDHALELVLGVIEKEGVERIVVGLPLNMDDTVGPQAKKTVEWGRNLEKRAAKPTVFVDERLSSFEAEQQLVERKRGGEHITRKGKKQRLDAIASASFLQAFLDGKLQPQTVSW
jgi:putative Holliday junction resolvase